MSATTTHACPVAVSGAKLSKERSIVTTQLRTKRFLALVISPWSKPGYQSPTGYDHYSLLRTIEDAWGLAELGGAACDCARPMTDFFVPNAAARR